MVATTLIKLGASMALLFSTLVVAAPTAADSAPLAKRTTGPSCADTQELQDTIIKTHNAHRVYHQVGDLQWDSTLASYAQNWVNKCVFEHSGGPYGENLYEILPGPEDDWNSATIDGLNAWVYEVKDYDYSNPGFAESTGHFTQFVWKGSTHVGCAWNTVDCSGKAIFSCNYKNAGNVIGQFPQNVFAPKSS